MALPVVVAACARMCLCKCASRHTECHKTYEAISNKCQLWTQMAVGNGDIVKLELECVGASVCVHASMNELRN